MSDRADKFASRFSSSESDEQEQDDEPEPQSSDDTETDAPETDDTPESDSTDEDTNSTDNGGEHKCDECGKELESHRGLQSHKGQVHSDDSAETVLRTDDLVRLQLRVPEQTRAEFNGIAQSKLEIEMNSRGDGELFTKLSQPELQNAAMRVVLNNIDEWADEIDSLYR